MDESRRMHVTSIRFGATVWDRVQRAAAHEGVSASQYVREAALLRSFLQELKRGEPVAGYFEQIAQEILQLSQSSNGPDDGED